MSSKRSGSKPVSHDLRLFLFGPGVGESVVMQLPCGGWGVVDCYQRDSSGRMGPLDFLKARKVKKLRFFCHTHPHEDHFMGAHRLLKHYKGRIQHIWRHPGFTTRDLTRKVSLAAKVQARAKGDPGADAACDDYEELLRCLAEEKERLPTGRFVRVVGSKAALLLSHKRYSIYALGPSDDILTDLENHLRTCTFTDGFNGFEDGSESGGLMNSLSVVLQITYGKAQVLLLGDSQGCEKEVHPEIKTHPEVRKCALVKVAHHGSANGLAATLITKLDGKTYTVNHALITPYKPSNLPRLVMIDKYKDACTSVLITHTDSEADEAEVVPGMLNSEFAHSGPGWVGFEISRHGAVKPCEVR